jgi:hypothetical protein
MADYFTHFSCLLDVGAPENAALALDLYNALSAEGASEDPPSEGFLLSIQPEHGGTNLWMRDDVTGDPERLIQFVKRCAAAFSLTGRWGFQYANTCSKPRLDGFGGGAVPLLHPDNKGGVLLSLPVLRHVWGGATEADSWVLAAEMDGEWGLYGVCGSVGEDTWDFLRKSPQKAASLRLCHQKTF